MIRHTFNKTISNTLQCPKFTFGRLKPYHKYCTANMEQIDKTRLRREFIVFLWFYSKICSVNNSSITLGQIFFKSTGSGLSNAAFTNLSIINTINNISAQRWQKSQKRELDVKTPPLLNLVGGPQDLSQSG